LKDARAALVSGPLTLYLGWLQSQLLAHGGSFFADQRLTIADLKVFSFIRGLVSGRLDHVPLDLVDQVAPEVSAHVKRIAQTPAIVAYYAKFGL
jgi:glutathione S-transferase